jgi:hypothetical protein
VGDPPPYFDSSKNMRSKVIESTEVVLDLTTRVPMLVDRTAPPSFVGPPYNYVVDCHGRQILKSRSAEPAIRVAEELAGTSRVVRKQFEQVLGV